MIHMMMIFLFYIINFILFYDCIFSDTYNSMILYIYIFWCVQYSNALLSKGGTSVPVGSAADENRHFEEAERENYHRHGPRARATFAAHGNNCTIIL